MTLSEFNTLISTIALCLSAFGLVALTFYLVRSISNYLKAKAMMMKYQIDMETDVSSIEEELEGIIMECLNYYTILNIEYRGDIVYINDPIEAQIRTGVTDMVTERLTDHRIARFNLVYNAASLADIIGKKVYLAVMNYRLTYNNGKSPIPNETSQTKS